jgi:hypothetical protein
VLVCKTSFHIKRKIIQPFIYISVIGIVLTDRASSIIIRSGASSRKYYLRNNKIVLKTILEYWYAGAGYRTENVTIGCKIQFHCLDEEECL